MAKKQSALQAKKLREARSTLREVLKELKPTAREIKEATVYANQLMGRLKKASPEYVEIILAGSVARGTQVRGSHDIDIFLLFPKEMGEEEMENKGLEIGKSIVKNHRNESYVIKYAEHPYVKLLLDDINMTADIVPAFKISSAEEMGSAVDRTQLHNLFVNSKLSKKQRDDVRLLKGFLNYHGVYGASARVEGFSGYLCELLVYHYGSFIGVIKNFSEIKVPLAIDPLGGAKGQPEIEELAKRFGSEMVVVDPTDRNRNVAANVSGESLAKFSISCRAFLRDPSKKVFFGPGHSDINARGSISRLRKELGVDIYVVCLGVKEVAEDILWQQLKKLRKTLEWALERNGFLPILSVQNIQGGKAIISFFMEKAENRSTKAKGPSAFMPEAADSFISAHMKSYLLYVEGERIFSIERPRYRTQKEFLRAAVLQNNINFPSYIKRAGAAIYVNSMPERYAKMLHSALADKTLL